MGDGTTDNTFYRITVEKEIREALRALPNGRIQDVTVEAITNGGYFTGVSTMSNGYTIAPASDITPGASGTIAADEDAFKAAKGGVIKFDENTHAFTMSAISASGVITFATDTSTPTSISTATASTVKANVGPNMLKVGKNRQILKIKTVACASNVLTFTHETIGTALAENDKVTVAGLQGTIAGIAANTINIEHTVKTGATTSQFTADLSCTDAAAVSVTAYGDVTALAANGGTAVATAVPVNGINYGDTIRIGDEFRRVVDDTGRHESSAGKIFRLTSGFAVPKTRDTVLGFATAVPAPAFKQNGMMYDITFESGCRTHADCRNNGIDENASDGPDPTPLVEGNDMGAVCHPGGACICSSDAYFGDGCTTDGRGSHAAPKKYVSGNINNLECDESGLTPSIPLRITGTVSRTDPRKVVLTATAEHDDNLPQSLSDIATATALTLAGDDAADYDYVVNDDQLNGFDVIFTKKATALSGGLSKTIEDSTASDNTFTTVTGHGGGHVDNDIVKITNLANGVKVGDMIRIEGQVRRVTYVSPLCKRGEIDNTDAASKAKSLCPGLVASSDHYLMVEEDFVEDEFSMYANIFEPRTVVERVESDSSQVATKGADLATCVVTDIRQLSSTTSTCSSTDGPTCGDGYVDAGV